ncbi:MAG: hypothetical protein ACK559_07805, partial [bacterium]
FFLSCYRNLPPPGGAGAPGGRAPAGDGVARIGCSPQRMVGGPLPRLSHHVDRVGGGQLLRDEEPLPDPPQPGVVDPRVAAYRFGGPLLLSGVQDGSDRPGPHVRIPVMGQLHRPQLDDRGVVHPQDWDPLQLPRVRWQPLQHELGAAAVVQGHSPPDGPPGLEISAACFSRT